MRRLRRGGCLYLRVVVFLGWEWLGSGAWSPLLPASLTWNGRGEVGWATRSALVDSEADASWASLGVESSVAGALEGLGYERPTPVQAAAVPVLLRGEDCVIHAATGSGKTAAYLAAVFARVRASRQAAQAAVIVPSRELGLQVASVARRLARRVNAARGGERAIRVMSLLEGSRLRRQRAWAWAEPPQVVVGNARQVAEMAGRGGLRCADLEIVVVDEADVVFRKERSSDRDHVNALLAGASTRRQTIYATATLDQPRHFVKKLAALGWARPRPAYVSPTSRLPETLDHCARRLEDPTKRLVAALDILRTCRGLPALIFCDSTRPLDAMAEALRARLGPGVVVDVLDPEANILERARALRGFSDENTDVLLATDLAARGIDLPRIRLVLSFDFPADAFAYQHRAGRAARAGNPGLAVTLVLDQERFALRRISNFLRIGDIPDLDEADLSRYLPVDHNPH